MKYVIGIDGGGTKTRFVIADESGCIMHIFSSCGTNYYLSSIETVRKVLCEGIEHLIGAAGIDKEDIAQICYALAGMDSAEDIGKMEAALSSSSVGSIPHIIENDVWIAFNAQTTLCQGAISICGTGHNTAVRLASGETFGIPSYRYPLGNHGGGRELCDCALNAAFLSRDHTGPSTELEHFVVQVCECASLEELERRVISSNYTYQYNYPVARAVSELAMKGDKVSIDILTETGRLQGRMTGNLVAYAGIAEEAFPIVLAGSVYCQKGNEFITQGFREGISERCRAAEIHILTHDPAEGAVLHAIDRLNGGNSASEADRILRRIHDTWEAR